MVTETVDEKVVLTTEQALSMLGDDDSIHTFRAVGNMLLGCDWDRAELEMAIRQNRCEIGGEMCKRTNHGLVVNVDGWLFVKCKDGFDYDQFEKSVTETAVTEKKCLDCNGQVEGVTELCDACYDERDRIDEIEKARG